METWFQPGCGLPCPPSIQDIRDANHQANFNMSTVATSHNQLTPDQLSRLPAELAIVANMLAMRQRNLDLM